MVETYRIQRRVDAYDTYDVSADTPGEAIAIIEKYDGIDKRVHELDLGDVQPNPMTCDDVEWVHLGDQILTRIAVAEWLTLGRAPKRRLCVTHSTRSMRQMTLDMVAVLVAAKHPHVTERVRTFVLNDQRDAPSHPIEALLCLQSDSIIWISDTARDLILTLHDMLNEIAPDGCFFGALAYSAELGFWEVTDAP